MTSRRPEKCPVPHGTIAPSPVSAQCIAPRPPTVPAPSSLEGLLWTARSASVRNAPPPSAGHDVCPPAPAAVVAAAPGTVSHGVRRKRGRPRKPSAAAWRAVDVVVANGVTFNKRGYKVCGVRNKRGMLCGRIGTCPFHASREPPPPPSAGGDPEGSDALDAAASSQVPTETGSPAVVFPSPSGDVAQPPTAAAELPVAPPAKGRFKRTWTTEEHSRFLVALQKHGRGKWKEIAGDVGTRSGSQCQSHACKYFKRQAKDKCDRKKHSIHDISEPNAPVVVQTPKKAAGSGSQSLRQDAQLLMPSVTVPMADVGDLAGGLIETEIGMEGSDGVDCEDVVDETAEPDVEVVVFLNHSSVAGQRLALPKSMNCEEFLCTAACKLGVPSQKLTRMFTRSGLEVDTLDSVMDGENLWLSDGADFSFIEPNVIGGTSENESHVAGDIATAEVDEDAVEVDIPEEDRVRVFVYLNGSAPVADSRYSMLFPASMDREEFLSDAADAFGLALPLTRIFTRSGSEIEHLDEIMDSEELWVSYGEEFACGS